MNEQKRQSYVYQHPKETKKDQMLGELVFAIENFMKSTPLNKNDKYMLYMMVQQLQKFGINYSKKELNAKKAKFIKIQQLYQQNQQTNR